MPKMRLAKEKKIYLSIILFASIVVPFIAYFNMSRYIEHIEFYHFIMPTTVGALLGFGVGNFYLLKLANRSLEDSHFEYKQLVDNIRGRYVLYKHKGAEGVITYASKGLHGLLGVEPDHILGKRWQDIINWIPEDITNHEKLFDEMIESPDKLFENELQFIDNDEKLRTWNVLEYATVDEDGKLISINGLLEDISDRRIGELQMQLLSNVFSHIKEAMIITDSNARIINTNETFTDLTGYTNAEILGKRTSILKSGRHTKKFYTLMWKELLESKKYEGEIWNKKKNGDVYYQSISISAMLNNNGQVTHYIGLLSDITERKEYEEQLKQQAFFDKLTQLPNRVLIYEKIDNMIAQTKRNNIHNALAFMDLDGFKTINDLYGHDMGDFVLKTVAKRVQKLLRQTDTIARLGGDEFVILLTNITNKSEVNLVLNKVLQSIAEPIIFNEDELKISSSIGVHFYPDDEDIDRDELIRRADKAMYKSKMSGKGRVTHYSYNSIFDINS